MSAIFTSRGNGMGTNGPLVHFLRAKAKQAAGRMGKKFTKKDKNQKESTEDPALNEKWASILKAASSTHPSKPDSRTVEDLLLHEQMAKSYSRQKMRQHRALMGFYNRAIRTKWEAVANLPKSLQEEAFTPDIEPFPIQRPTVTTTPPIPGFDGFDHE